MDDYDFESESYEEMEEEEDVGHDESPQVITIVTALHSAGSHRPRTRLSLPNSGYEIDNVQSTASTNMLKNLKKTFSIPNTIFLHLPKDNDLPTSNSSITVLRDHEADRVNTLFSVSEQDRDYRLLLDPKLLCRLGLSPFFCSKQGILSLLVNLPHLVALHNLLLSGGAPGLSITFLKEPRVGDDTPSGYLQHYSQQVMGMASIEEDSLITGSVDEYGFMASHFTDSVCKLATEVTHHKQRISFLNDSIKNLENQLWERDAKLMDCDNSIRVLELDRELTEKTVSELKLEKAQLEAQNAFLVRKKEKRERMTQRERKKNANVYLRGYMDAQAEVHGRDPSYPMDWMAYPYNQEAAQVPDSPGSADSPDSSEGNDIFPA
ncbi:hypothetical protein LWI29_004702 [Acer saccharum]|uniref:Uncharacterized protein n=1 Tax=Acer saccharum TaxID=4024 RepID=A0AA39SZY7_ACESA|nr:hypothetical protein LWI29_004702 [Acer saccharum]